MNELNKVIEQLKPELVPLLIELIKFKTVTPPSDTRLMVDYIKRYLGKYNIRIQTQDVAGSGMVNCFVRIGEDLSRPSIAMHSHLDVVDAGNSELWDNSPFGGEILDGCIWGRGTIDMKGFLAVQILTLIAIASVSEQLSLNLIFLGTADEERGGKIATRSLIEQKAAELRNIHWLISEGGCIYERRQGMVNVVGCAERKSYPLKIVITSRNGGHAGIQTDTDRNIIYLYPQILDRITEYNKKQLPIEISAINSEFVSWFRESHFLRNSFLNTIVPTITKSGIKRNVIPNMLEISCDCRINLMQNEDEFIAQVREMFKFDGYETTVEEPVISEYNPKNRLHYPPEDPVFLQLVSDVTKLPSSYVCLPFMTDLCHFREKGIQCFGYAPFKFTDDQLNLYHNYNEHININTLQDGFDIFARLIYKACTM